MFVIEPIRFEDIYATNIPSMDYAAWLAGTTYAAGAQVTHERVNYQSVQGSNTGNTPPPWTGGDLTWWVPISYTRRWRPFDESLGGYVENADTIWYSLVLPRTINSVALFGLNGEALRVSIISPEGATIFSQYIELTESDEVYDAWTYFFNEIDYSERIVVRDLPGYSGNRIRIDIYATGGTAKVSEIFIGNAARLGVTTVGTQVGIRDYSIKERDEFGNQRIVERGFTSVVTFQFAFPTEEVTRIKKIMTRIRSSAAVFFSNEDDPTQLGTLIPGFYKDFNVPLTTVESYGVLEVESLT